MKLSDYHNTIRKQVREYLRDQLSPLVLQEGKSNLQYKKLLHHLGTYREDAWGVISSFRQDFDKKIYSITQAISDDPKGIQQVIEVLSNELKQKAASNKKSVDNQFGKGTANSLFEYLRGHRSDFIQALSALVAEREEIRLDEEEQQLSEKGAISSAILEAVGYAKEIGEKFSGKTPSGTIMLQYADLIDPDRWIRKVTSDVFNYIINHSEQEGTDDFEEDVYFRVQNTVGEMILTTPVWLLSSLADELKQRETQIIVEIIFVSMLSPNNLEIWDKLFRRMGLGSITFRIAKVLKHINK